MEKALGREMRDLWKAVILQATEFSLMFLRFRLLGVCMKDGLEEEKA